MGDTPPTHGPLSTQTGTLPQPFPENQIILVAAPSQELVRLLCYRLWCHHLPATNPSLFVTTDRSDETILDGLRETECETTNRQVGIVDSYSKAMRVVDSYQDVPVIYIEDITHITQLFVAIYDMRDQFLAAPETHILIPSLTPVLSDKSLGPALRALETLLTSGRTGTSALGVDYTVHEPETMNALESISDRILWAEQLSNGEIQIHSEGGHRLDREYFSTR